MATSEKRTALKYAVRFANPESQRKQDVGKGRDILKLGRDTVALALLLL
jgi:hypothetical protein